MIHRFTGLSALSISLLWIISGCGKPSDAQKEQPRLEIVPIALASKLTDSGLDLVVRAFMDMSLRFKVTGLDHPTISCKGCPASAPAPDENFFNWWPNEWDVGAHELVFTAKAADGSEVSATVDVMVEFDGRYIGSTIGTPLGRDVALLAGDELELSDSHCYKGKVRTACPWIREVKTDVPLPLPQTLAVMRLSEEDQADVVILHSKKLPASPRHPYISHLYRMETKILDDATRVEFPLDRQAIAGQMTRILIRCQGSARMELKSELPEDKLVVPEQGMFRGEAGPFIAGSFAATEYEFTPRQAGYSKLMIHCIKGDKILSQELVFTVSPP